MLRGSNTQYLGVLPGAFSCHCRRIGLKDNFLDGISTLLIALPFVASDKPFRFQHKGDERRVFGEEQSKEIPRFLSKYVSKKSELKDLVSVEEINQ